MYTKQDLTEKLSPIDCQLFRSLKQQWFEGYQQCVTKEQYIETADEWFRGSTLNNIQGWEKFPYVDAIMGCTHFIESLILKHGWDGIQILPDEYGYYGMMGKFGVDVDDLEPNKPLIVSIPNWKYLDTRPEWDRLLQECERKNIDIHIDFAWIIVARDISINLDHPNIKSFAMSLSKYSLEWNRVGLRWAKHRSMDSVTMFNHYHGEVNTAQMSCGHYMMNNIPRDYLWNSYGDKHLEVCRNLDLHPSKIIYSAHQPNQAKPVGLGKILSCL